MAIEKCMTQSIGRKKSKPGHSWQGLLCLNAKSWLRCSHISQPGLTQLYSVHHEFTKIWCFNINISQSSDLWDIYLVNPSSILALKPHSNCLRLVLHASIKVNDDGLPRVVLAQLFLNLILILNLIPIPFCLFVMLQGCKIVRLQGCKVVKLCKVVRILGCKVARLQGCKVVRL